MLIHCVLKGVSYGKKKKKTRALSRQFFSVMSNLGWRLKISQELKSTLLYYHAKHLKYVACVRLWSAQVSSKTNSLFSLDLNFNRKISKGFFWVLCTLIATGAWTVPGKCDSLIISTNVELNRVILHGTLYNQCIWGQKLCTDVPRLRELEQQSSSTFFRLAFWQSYQLRELNTDRLC